MITRKNIAEMMDLITAAYGEKTFPDSPERMSKVINLWSVMFKDDDPVEVLLAVKDCISTLQFAPKIADIKSRISRTRLQGQMTELEAWVTVRNAVKRAKSAAEANAAFLHLPAILRRIVVEPSTLREWNKLPADTLEGVIASNFQRSYRETARLEAAYNALPKDIQAEQSWMVDEPAETAMLPEPAQPKSIDEIHNGLEADTQKFRVMQGIEAKPKYSSAVTSFLKPLTPDELKEFEAKRKHAETLRMERIKNDTKGASR